MTDQIPPTTKSRFTFQTFILLSTPNHSPRWSDRPLPKYRRRTGYGFPRAY
jgi:hypothetical protein